MSESPPLFPWFPPKTLGARKSPLNPRASLPQRSLKALRHASFSSSHSPLQPHKASESVHTRNHDISLSILETRTYIEDESIGKNCLICLICLHRLIRRCYPFSYERANWRCAES